MQSGRPDEQGAMGFSADEISSSFCHVWSGVVYATNGRFSIARLSSSSRTSGKNDNVNGLSWIAARPSDEVGGRVPSSVQVTADVITLSGKFLRAVRLLLLGMAPLWR